MRLAQKNVPNISPIHRQAERRPLVMALQTEVDDREWYTTSVINYWKMCYSSINMKRVCNKDTEMTILWGAFEFSFSVAGGTVRADVCESPVSCCRQLEQKLPTAVWIMLWEMLQRVSRVYDTIAYCGCDSVWRANSQNKIPICLLK